MRRFTLSELIVVVGLISLLATAYAFSQRRPAPRYRCYAPTFEEQLAEVERLRASGAAGHEAWVQAHAVGQNSLAERRRVEALALLERAQVLLAEAEAPYLPKGTVSGLAWARLELRQCEGIRSSIGQLRYDLLKQNSPRRALRTLGR